MVAVVHVLTELLCSVVVIILTVDVGQLGAYKRTVLMIIGASNMLCTVFQQNGWMVYMEL